MAIRSEEFISEKRLRHKLKKYINIGTESMLFRQVISKEELGGLG